MQRRTERGREGRLPESHEGVPEAVRTLLYLFERPEKRGPDETDPPDHAADPRLFGSAYDAGYIGDRFPRKTKQVVRMVRRIPGKVTVGCTTLGAVSMYERLFRELFPDQAAVCHSGGRHIQTQGKDYR